MDDKKKKSLPKGFAAIDPARQRYLAHLGGTAAHAKGKAYEYNSEQAKEAGRKGGLRTAQLRRETGYYERLVAERRKKLAPK